MAASKLPHFAKEWLLQGRYLRYPELFGAAIAGHVPIRFLATFPRFEALRSLRQSADFFGLEIEVTDTGVFRWSEQAVDAFEQHLLRNTYILCPRGAENYSFRVFEALRFGRVPVIVDTDMVLPGEVPWEDVALVVPYNRVNDVGALIAEDYRTRSAEQFMTRQRLAIETSAMLDQGSWLADVAQDICRRIEERAPARAQSFERPMKTLDSAPVF
nr:exostosin family protein [Sphingomonas arenae]